MNNTLRVGITQGDINGVGLEVILKTMAVPEMTGVCTPVIYGASKVLAYHRKALDLQLNINFISQPEEAAEGRVNMISLTDDELQIVFGQPSAEAGAAAFAALQRAVADLREGKIDVLVTAPVNKSTIQCDDFHFCGHTEYIETELKPEKSSQETPDPGLRASSLAAGAPATAPEEDEPAQQTLPPVQDEALMILMNDALRVALVTTHLPLRAVADAVTQEAIVRKLRIFDRSLRRDFSVTRPRIAVLSLNPHAGDGGLLGEEEQTVIKPAMDEANKNGVHAYGPYAADGFFGTRAYEHFDGVLAMYHDQGLAAFKALTMDNGVNFTAGLSAVRTSPDHGVAYDIAGKGVADETSFREAVYSAIDIYRNRKAWDEAYVNPLHKLYRERKEDERPFGRQPQMRLGNKVTEGS